MSWSFLVTAICYAYSSDKAAIFRSLLLWIISRQNRNLLVHILFFLSQGPLRSWMWLSPDIKFNFQISISWFFSPQQQFSIFYSNTKCHYLSNSLDMGLSISNSQPQLIFNHSTSYLNWVHILPLLEHHLFRLYHVSFVAECVLIQYKSLSWFFAYSTSKGCTLWSNNLGLLFVFALVVSDSPNNLRCFAYLVVFLTCAPILLVYPIHRYHA